MKNTNNNFNITNEDALNFITALEYLSDELKQIDCRDFECNAYQLLNDCNLTQTLRANIKPIPNEERDVTMKINVWYSVRGKFHCFSSCWDDCNYCYPIEQYTFEEACARYEADHVHEHCEYHYIVK